MQQSQLLMALMQALQPQQAQPLPNAKQMSPLARAMYGRVGREGRKNASLDALKPYGESDWADSLAGRPNAPQGAFQGDAFQNDAFQVDGVI